MRACPAVLIYLYDHIFIRDFVPESTCSRELENSEYDL